MSKESNKTMVYALIGAGALVVGALAFNYFANKPAVNSQCFEEIDALGPP